MANVITEAQGGFRFSYISRTSLPASILGGRKGVENAQPFMISYGMLRIMSQTSVLKWARESFIPLSTVTSGAPWKDLAPLGEMIGDANVVAPSEGVHCAAEPLEFRNRLFQYLAQESANSLHANVPAYSRQ